MVTLHIVKYSHIAFFSLLLISLPSFGADETEALFHGESSYVLKSAYERAPRRAHRIVESLSGRDWPGRYPFNYAIFDGEPGVGKSTLALAIAYELKWDVQKFGTNDFMKIESRNGTSVIFNQMMSQFEDSDEKTVIILDEINHLLMNYNSKHHDTDASAMSLWLFLDNIRNKKNLFLIGTTNGIGGFPPQIRSRCKGAVITIEAEKNIDRIKKMLLEGLSHDPRITILDEAKDYINQCAVPLEGYSARDINYLIYEIKGQADEGVEVQGDNDKSEEDDKLIIKLGHIKAALDDFADLEVRFDVKPYHEVEFEQRERHHQEILNQNKQYQEVALEQNWKQFWIGTTVNVCGVGLSLYFNNLNCAKALAAQLVMHKDSMDQQKVFHGQMLEQQSAFHAQIMQQQQKLHNEGLQQQVVLHHEQIRNQQGIHAEGIRIQVNSIIWHLAIAVIGAMLG